MKQRIMAGAILILLLLAGSACRNGTAEENPTAVPATPTSAAITEPTPSVEPADFVTVATSAPYAPFEYFDEFGTVVGFDAEVLDQIMAQLEQEHEFVVTNFDGMLDSVAAGEFDMAVSAYLTPEDHPGVVFTNPYLEVAQVLVVLANERDIQGYGDLRPGMRVGVLPNSFGEQAALGTLNLMETDLQYYGTAGQALQGLISGQVRGVIIDHDDALQFTETYFQQLKIAGGTGREAWITSRQYVMAVREDDPVLLQGLNRAIADLREDGSIERLTRNWLVSSETLDAGESLVGTPADVLVIGVMGQAGSVDPAAGPDMLGWEIKRNTMSGLVMYDLEGNLVPVLAADMPEVSADRLEYTFLLRNDLVFPDGTPLTAEAVKWSIDRSASGGNWHVNSFLKDSDENLIADSDAVQVLAPNQIKIVLKAPTSYFLSVLATPPYYVANPECYTVTEEPAFRCAGIGPYEIIEWEQGDRLQLKLNPQWPAEFGRPVIENVQLRFYTDAARMRNALEIEAIDMAWTGFPEDMARELATAPGLRSWQGPWNFKSYIVFEQSEPPWDNPTVRQAAALAIDRAALAEGVFAGRRAPLFSPVPEGVPGHLATLPPRDLEQSRSLLNFLGYTEANPLAVTLSYLNDGRYTVLEEAYAQAIAAQLEETGIFQVTLEGASWDVFSVQISACEYPAFLLGWPPVGWPTRYPAAMGWMEYFVTNTDLLCSNYASPAMDALVTQLRELDPLDTAGQQAVYEQMQTLWAEEYPTVSLTQAAAPALAWEGIDNVVFDNMGLLLYSQMTKSVDGAP